MRSFPKTLFPAMALLSGFALPACSGSPGDASTDTTSNADTSQANFPAHHCEVFVDRVHPHFDSHGVEVITLYFKTPLDKLASRGGVKSVGFHAQAVTQGATSNTSDFSDIVARPFVNAKDYWEIDLDIESDFTPATTYTGAFYVEATDGTRFWVNATAGDRNFFVDPNMVQNLANLRPQGFFATENGPDTSIVAVDEFPYLNPGECR
jgi:hypothetical protein